MQDHDLVADGHEDGALTMSASPQIGQLYMNVMHDYTQQMFYISLLNIIVYMQALLSSFSRHAGSQSTRAT